MRSCAAPLRAASVFAFLQKALKRVASLQNYRLDGPERHRQFAATSLLTGLYPASPGNAPGFSSLVFS
jgi:hypothetical protein